MNVYYSAMRIQDDTKKAALFEATIKLVNEIGFVSSSVSKIAKEAGISPSTIYVYYKNKEDLLVSTYFDIKIDISKAVLRNFDDALPIRDIFMNVWRDMFDYIANNQSKYHYVEQFTNSPYISLVDKDLVDKHFIPLIHALERGIALKIIKDVDRKFHVAFMFHPITMLANPLLSPELEMDEKAIEIAFSMAWDAIRL